MDFREDNAWEYLCCTWMRQRWWNLENAGVFRKVYTASHVFTKHVKRLSNHKLSVLYGSSKIFCESLEQFRITVSHPFWPMFWAIFPFIGTNIKYGPVLNHFIPYVVIKSSWSLFKKKLNKLCFLMRAINSCQI